MEFSTIIIILIYALTFRLMLGSVLVALIKLLFRDEPKAYSIAFDRYLTRKSAYKMIMSLSYVIILNVVSSLNYPVPQTLWLVGMLILVEFSVFLYYELTSYGYSELKNGLGHYRWFVV